MDAILTSRYTTNDLGQPEATAAIVGLQVTIGKEHRDREIQFLLSSEDWAKALSVTNVVYYFVYLWETIPHNRVHTVQLDEKTRGNRLAHPAYTRIHLKIRDVCENVGAELESVSISMRNTIEN